MLNRYGSNVHDLLAMLREDPSLAEPLPGADDYLRVEARYAVTHEGARHLEDVLARRTRISIETAHRGAESAADTARLMGAVLGWDAARQTREIDTYIARVEAERESQTMPDDLSADAARLGAPDVRAVPAS
jgi:glycerol-3-phosphate dehydrogenase